MGPALAGAGEIREALHFATALRAFASFASYVACCFFQQVRQLRWPSLKQIAHVYVAFVRVNQVVARFTGFALWICLDGFRQRLFEGRCFDCIFV